ncbi:hypothetical protein F941_00432 [Acinetobacter bouvetii DSM 14964 = CIP 107468]|jgi:uncharacterized membrane protein|uniref:Uncharacterized protein n=1 Tax=Acinetobacter bouvetii DSM 14964 = CIP 107468 TaxID=1120925 RepID=N9DU89_9GAMM|nr:hypothetical protein [Acinetobacter bouvetii]ENV84023.1 hypothetical protein F941_00432 [Acinetobacter bouvetii DSM 14964 = CIP 107468]BCU65916.1 hypothetical protein ACBO_27070 [Acinetobacter bouvetii]
MFIMYLGFAVILIGAIGFLIAAFKNSILWGLGCLLFSPISIVFLILYWQDAKNPFFLQLIGILIVFLGSMFISPAHISGA